MTRYRDRSRIDVVLFLLLLPLNIALWAVWWPLGYVYGEAREAWKHGSTYSA